ncbi:MAG TPA: YezD family protein [Methylococcaceae bacterium]|nr:YezD family protein [Methylococcaceae bacterium]
MTQDRPHRVTGATDGSNRAELDRLMEHILRTLQSIEYGSIEITIHNSAVVKIERTEKIRFDRRSDPRPT